MDQNLVISVEKLSKIFRIPHDLQRGLKGTLLSFIKGTNTYEEFYALKDVNLSIKKGEVVGIIAKNGAGKSTLLKIIAGILVPSSGRVYVNGKIASFLELGLGFQMELTAKENIYLYGAILGLSKIEINNRYEDIINFSELHRFIDMKLKNYSTGMLARLAFSIAIQSNSDILLVDEVLAVGDIQFQKKCLKFFESIKSDKTVIMVSHDLYTVEKLCNRCIFIDQGIVIADGKTSNVINEYKQFLNS